MGEAGDDGAPGDQVPPLPHGIEDLSGGDPVAGFGVETDERVEDDRVEVEAGLGELGVDEFAELEVPRPDTGSEEDGEGEEVGVGHEIEGGDRIAETAGIGESDQTVLESLEGGRFRRVRQQCRRRRRRC